MDSEGRWATDERTEYIVQHLYAAGLSLQLCLDQGTRQTDRARLERAIAVLEGLITELSASPWRPVDQ
jgi:hypothetical protein